jgi:long-chain acyl-CoA synthetase
MADDPWLANYAPGVDWHAPLTPRPLYQLLDDAVERYANKPAIDFLGRTFTYAELGEMVAKAARGFQDLGVGPGIKVGLFLPNCPQFVVCYYAVLKAGGTVVNFSPLYSEEELLHQIEDSHTDVMVTLDLKALYPKMATLLGESRLKKLVVGSLAEVLPIPKSWLFPLLKRREIAAVPNDASHVSFRELLNNDGDYARIEIEPERDTAILQYTGGTTGISKGAMLSHANLYVNTLQTALWMSDLRQGDERMMGVLPFFHVFAMTVVMNMSVHLGAEIIIHPRFVLEDVMRDIPRKKPTLMPGVPTMFGAVAGHPEAGRIDLTSVRACISGGAPLPAETKQRFEELTGAVVFEGYGLTETSPVCSCNPFQGTNKPGSIGQPVPGTRIVISDPEEPRREMPQGEAGEITIQGPQVMQGYWQQPEATAEVMVDGRLRTGDIGYMDEEGYTFIIDRIKDLVLVGGFNVYPRHVEEAIYQHPAVEETTVIGIPDDYRGQSVKAFVKQVEGGELTADELHAFLVPKLGKHELPAEIEFRDELPKTMIGKLSKKELVAEEVAKHEAKKQAADAGEA